MFRTYQKNDFAYFVSLIFLVFPVLGVLGGYYPVWTLVLTGLFTIAYLLMVYLKKAYSKWIPFLFLSSDTLDFDVIILPIERRLEYSPHVYGYSPLFVGNVLFSKPYTSGEKDGRSQPYHQYPIS